MTTDVTPPELDVPEAWRLVSEETAVPFDVRLVTVVAATRIYEDVSLRERLAAATGADTMWRFVFASRVRLQPSRRPSGALTRLVTDRASSSFLDVLDDRGFSEVDRVDVRRIPIDGADVDATRYRARVALDGRDLPAEAYFAAWPDGESFLLGGGAYPLSLPDGDAFDPERGRSELFELLRSIE